MPRLPASLATNSGPFSFCRRSSNCALLLMYCSSLRNPTRQPRALLPRSVPRLARPAAAARRAARRALRRRRARRRRLPGNVRRARLWRRRPVRRDVRRRRVGALGRPRLRQGVRWGAQRLFSAARRPPRLCSAHFSWKRRLRGGAAALRLRARGAAFIWIALSTFAACLLHCRAAAEISRKRFPRPSILHLQLSLLLVTSFPRQLSVFPPPSE